MPRIVGRGHCGSGLFDAHRPCRGCMGSPSWRCGCSRGSGAPRGSGVSGIRLFSFAAHWDSCPSKHLRPGDSSSDRACPELYGPHYSPNDYDTSTYDEPHQPCRRLGSAKKDSKSALKTRLLTLDQSKRKRDCEGRGRPAPYFKKTLTFGSDASGLSCGEKGCEATCPVVGSGPERDLGWITRGAVGWRRRAHLCVNGGSSL